MKKKWMIGLLLTVVVLAAGVGVHFLAGLLDKDWILSINGEKMSTKTFKSELAKLEPVYQELFKEDPDKFIEGFINHTLLQQAARKEGAVPQGSGEGNLPAIQAYMEKKMASLPPVGEDAVKRFYEEKKDQLGGQNKEAAAPMIKAMLEQQQRYELMEKLITDLRKQSKIEVNQKALRQLAASTAGSDTQSGADFYKAISGGKPMVVDFGANSCIPCRQLRPILQKIRQAYTGKIEVQVIDIRYNKQLADEYKIQVIPTVVFFDRTGKEVFRHQGFMNEESIKAQLLKMDVI
jgi:thioredoxin 1